MLIVLPVLSFEILITERNISVIEIDIHMYYVLQHLNFSDLNCY